MKGHIKQIVKKAANIWVSKQVTEPKKSNNPEQIFFSQFLSNGQGCIHIYTSMIYKQIHKLHRTKDYFTSNSGIFSAFPDAQCKI